MRPSELWGISWPLTAFYFDRGVRNWANFVDQRANEAEQAVRMQMKNRKGTDPFALQARHVAFNKMVGLSVDSAYAAPTVPGRGNAEKRGPKRDLGKLSVPRVIDAEGKSIDLSRFNG